MILGRRPAAVGRCLLRVVVFVVVTFLFWWAAAGLISPFVDALVASALSLGVAVTGSTAVMMRLYEMRPFHQVGLFANRSGMVHLGIGVALGGGSSLLIIGVQWLCGWVRMERAPNPDGWPATLGFGLVVLVVGAVGEELLFRGYGFQQLISAFGPRLSILSTSLLFGWAHTANPAFTRVSMINTALFGLVFGYAYWRTRDLWLPLGMHWAWNFSLAAVGANVSGLKIKLLGLSVVSTGPPLWSGGDYGPEASLLATMILAGTAVFLWKARLERQWQGLLAVPEGGNA
jgi:membrane protease YdiL (CAAX protease family)